MSRAKTGTVVPKCEGYHQGITATKKRAPLDSGPINHQLINRACALFFLRRGLPAKEAFNPVPEHKG